MSEKKQLNPLALVLGVSVVFFVLFLLISGGLWLRSGMKSSSVGQTEVASRGFFGKDSSVGVLELTGVIMDSKRTLAKLERIGENDQIQAVVLRLNSPGGAVAPSQEIYQAVKSFKKPLVISMGSVAASGAYYIAAGAKKDYANPGTITGSIGVIIEFLNLQKLYEWAKVQRYVVKTGKFKDTGAEYRSMTPEEQAVLQAMVNDVLSQFREAVAQGRKMPMEKVVQISDGRIFSGRQAHALGLVDELGGVQQAIEGAARLAGIQGKPKVVYFEKSKSWVERLMEDSASVEERDTVQAPFSSTLHSSPSHWSGFLLQWAQLIFGGRSEVSEGTAWMPGPYLIWGR
ncbi:MAG: signal peptide peptidase SppA [Bdellovibrionia bacterium]